VRPDVVVEGLLVVADGCCGVVGREALVEGCEAGADLEGAEGFEGALEPCF
jgi:hypothetical protein